MEHSQRGSHRVCTPAPFAIFYLLAVFVLLSACATHGAHAKGVVVSLEAPWTETPFLQESCEWAGRTHGASGFYKCLEALWSKAAKSEGDAAQAWQGGARTLPQEAQYSAAKEMAREVFGLSGSAAALFSAEMAARVYSPAVEAHSVLAVEAKAAATADKGKGQESCTAQPFAMVFDVRGAQVGVATDAKELKRLIVSASIGAPQDCYDESKEDARAGVVAQVVYDRLDYVYPSFSYSDDLAASVSIDGVVVVLYGLVGEATSMLLYDAVQESAEDTHLVFVFRHLPASAMRLCGDSAVGGDAAASQWESPLVLQGYGATVDFKSMEYKVIDEKKAATDEEGKGEKSDSLSAKEEPSVLASEEAIIGGIDIGLLKKRFSDLSGKLDTFATYLEDAVSGGAGTEARVDFDLWELQNIGVAAAQMVSEAGSPEEKLRALTDIVSHFPLHASRLSRIAADQRRVSEISAEVKQLQQVFGLAPADEGLVFLNGHLMEPREVSLYGLLEMLREEEKRIEGTRKVLTTRRPYTLKTDTQEVEAEEVVAVDDATMLRIRKELASHVARYLSGDADEEEDDGRDEPGAPLRVNMPVDHVLWLNDIESDEMYQSLPVSLKALLQPPTRGGHFLFPRRNLIHIVAIVDPSSISGMQSIMTLFKLMQQGMMARLGLVIVDKNWQETVDDREDETRVSSAGTPAGVSGSTTFVRAAMMAATMQILKEEEGIQAVAKFIIDVFQLIEKQHGSSGDDIPEVIIRSAAERALKGISDTPVMSLITEKDFLEPFQRVQHDLHTRMHATGESIILINGAVSGEGSSIGEVVRSEMASLGSLVSMGVLKDNMEDLYTVIMQHYRALPHFQPALEGPSVAIALNTKEMADFLHWRAFMPLTTYDGATPVVTSVFYIPRNATALRSLRLLLASMEAMEQCTTPRGSFWRRSSSSSSIAPECTGTQLTLAVPTHVLPSAVGAEVDTMAGLLEVVWRAVAAQVGETKRLPLLAQYVRHLLQVAENAKLGEEAQLCDPAALSVLVAATPTTTTTTTATTKEQGGRISVPAAVQKVLLAYRGKDPERSDLPLQNGLVTAFNLHIARERRKPQEQPSAMHLGEEDSTALFVLNGRVVALEGHFIAEDFALATRQQTHVGSAMRYAVEKIPFTELSAGAVGFTADELDASFIASKVAALASVMNTARAGSGGLPREEQVVPPLSALPHTSFSVEPPAGVAVRHQLTAVVDPSSRGSQLLVSLCDFASRSGLGIRLSVVLNPSLDVKKPIRNVFTYVVEAEPVFDAATGRTVEPIAVFRGLPARQLLTLGVEEPESWIVFPLRAEHDLDNIILDRLPKGNQFLTATYGLRAMLVTGSATAAGGMNAGTPPSGLPLVLRTRDERTDTMVMANYGYYQLRATPGVWRLSVQPGPAAAAFYISNIAGRSIPLGGSCHPRSTDSDGVAAAGVDDVQQRQGVDCSKGQGIPIIVDSLRGQFISLEVRGVAGNEKTMDSIGAELAAQSHRQWPPSRGDKEAVAPPPKPTLNVFSVASGHLYERFLRMMMYSVFTASSDKHGANTTRVKFWVIENFLSPQFKEYIPLLAQSYGFEVGFVSYHWPWWLPKQTEKQRKIWAYKILFLDVLFPLDVERVIFVDADQSARADLHELYNMDIKDNAIAMTPFCVKHPNTATVGFRFWQHGFWKDHLRGRPYHISAIFLVDLQRFRAMRVGDRYRAVYSQLSHDPNSLSNLDQDLPNYLQPSVPIFSLPEEWLWCETWCSADSKASAKTIDLCNNPLTKMPKLDNAKFIIPNWENTDDMLEKRATDVLEEHRKANMK